MQVRLANCLPTLSAALRNVWHPSVLICRVALPKFFLEMS